MSRIRLALLLSILACTGDKGAAGDDTQSGESDADADADADVDRDPHLLFPAGAVWYEDLSAAPTDDRSATVMAGLQSHGWGLGRLQIDFSIEVLEGDAATPRMDFIPKEGEFYSPDCDAVPMPVPAGGVLEGETGYTCESDGDCHLIVVERDENKLYEMWRADLQGSDLYGGCLAVWDLNTVYPAEGRGDQCTSADAAGYPIAQLLFTADEVAAGEINHGIRLALPNSIIQDGVFYHPASHATNAGGGGEEAVPYGARLRLKPDFDLNRIENENARVIARAMMKHGLYLADGGNVALMGRSDRSSVHTWAELGIDSHALEGIEPQDFELVELGSEPIELTFECERNGL